MRVLISVSVCLLGEVVVTCLEETSSIMKRRVKTVFSEGNILWLLSAHLSCWRGGLARAFLPRCWAQHHFYRAQKDQHLHGLPNIGVFLC